MRSWRAFLDTVHLTTLGLWLGTVIMEGVAAARSFPVIRELDPVLPNFQVRTNHWRLIAGRLNQSVFLFGDIIQFFCAILAVLSLVGLVAIRAVPRRSPATWIRSLALSVAFASLAGLLLIVTPSMNASFQATFEAALTGNADAMAFHRAEFGKLHPIATKLMGGTAFGVFIALVAGAWATSRAAAEAPALAGRSARYEDPALLGR